MAKQYKGDRRERLVTWDEQVLQLRELRDKLQVIADRMEVNMGKKSGTDTAAWVADVREYRRLMAEATELIRSPWNRSEGGAGGDPQESKGERQGTS